MMQSMEFICVPGSVQDAENWGKNLHSSEDWDSLVYWAIEQEQERESEAERWKEELTRWVQVGGI